ncbi:MAG: glutamine-hydrolyzing carbamoyl-phosphate synthase small subunit [Proteiniphilum sp.]|uniref:glutamine-hydrolyzing carbamoyl-phosphate synthase small subunit n=1 Tax=Proteiniphilum sp. TaxID=1926877 RepID=UPI002AB9C0A9|nr:glutamine-hydrolyzing carbamoyl-phosphate synthase small subunit [Proteiniphilum sp.]MDY9918276.1 glutamine-hydrolyzing carbamoyl-phosphate synthase small subunit [Proteiniphilum sp.]
MHRYKPVRLILENGMFFHGQSFGAEKATSGEVVFNTAMVGYPESLTDPSYEGQILTLTYPIIGNYGVPAHSETDGISDFFESEHIHACGLIVQDYSREHSHWNAVKSLGDWLKEEGVPGICGVDTRLLTKILREKGSMLGKIVYEEDGEVDFYDPETENLVAKVSCSEVIEYGQGEKKVVLIDCGAKLNIVRELVKQGVRLIRVPWDYDFNRIDYDGVMISNGPGNPDHCGITVAHIREAMKKEKPIFGICMGNQLLSKAAGANIYKLKYGHRSHNQPVQKVGSSRCYITSQNHGYAVDESQLGAGWEPWFVNMNDGTNEGIRHKTKPFYSVQFHPEATGGPTDTRFFFEEFVKML